MAELIYSANYPITLSGNEDKIVDPDYPFVVIYNTTNDVVYVAKDKDILLNVNSKTVKKIEPGKAAYVAAGWGVHKRFYALGNGDIETESFCDENVAAKMVKLYNQAQTRIENYISNPNLLINSNFKVNQRKVSGTITDKSFFVDRWKLVDGTVTVNDDGTLTLNGTISQTLEFDIGTVVSASASGGSSHYDLTTRTYTLTASNEVIEWAKLETGTVPTLFTPPDPATELIKCQRYYYSSNTQIVFSAKNHMVPHQNYYSLPVTMRIIPTITIADAAGIVGYASLRNDNTVKIQMSYACANARDFNLWATNQDMTENSEYRLTFTADAEI